MFSLVSTKFLAMRNISLYSVHVFFIIFFSQVLAELRPASRLKHAKSVDEEIGTCVLNGLRYENIPLAMTKKIEGYIRRYQVRTQTRP